MIVQAPLGKSAEAEKALAEVEEAIEPRLNAFMLAYRRFWREYAEIVPEATFESIAANRSVSVAARRDLAEMVDGFVYKNLVPRLLDVSEEAFDQLEGVVAEAAEQADPESEVEAQADELVIASVGIQVQAWIDVARLCVREEVEDTPDVLRAVTGLSVPDALAVARRHISLIRKMSRQEAAHVWGLLTRRATLTAENQLARAHQNAKRLAHRRALDLGLAASVTRIWVTERDANVCRTCARLEGKTLVARTGGSIYKAFGKDERGKNITNPPGHFKCRCSVVYQVEPATTGMIVKRLVEKHLRGQHDQKTHGRRYGGEMNDLILDILGGRKGGKQREPSVAELKRIREHVANSGFPTNPTKVGRRLDGAMLPDGSVLKRGDPISSAKAHWAFHVVVNEEWPPGTTQQKYESDIRDIVKDPDSGIFASFMHDGWHLAFIRKSGDLQGPNGHEWVMVEYRLHIEHVMTSFQPRRGLAWFTNYGGRKRKRWLQKPKGI